MERKIRKIMDSVSEILELIMAVIVVCAIVSAIFFLKEPFLEFINHHLSADAFLELMIYVLNIVIGVEFFKMLCNPGIGTVLDVLIFVIARHMIVHDTSSIENLVTIIGISVIIIVKKYLNTIGEKRRDTKE